MGHSRLHERYKLLSIATVEFWVGLLIKIGTGKVPHASVS